jgi:hypothetical protein
MKKYYLMAAEKGHTHGITHLKTYNRNKTWMSRMITQWSFETVRIRINLLKNKNWNY